MESTPLAAQIALRVLEMIQTGEAAPGSHVRENVIAEEFGVSRSPVRDALALLISLRLVRRLPHRGCFIASPSRSLVEAARKKLAANDQDAVYREIAAKRLDGELPATFTEADLGRQFDLSRAEVGRIVDRMAQEGWIERRHGYGWEFVPILTTLQSFDLGYRFRRAIEPIALLEPSFTADPEAFARFRAEQQALANRALRSSDSIGLFQLGSRFHEMLARCSGNPFFLDALQRVNRVRRLLEYRAMVDTSLFTEQAREHLVLLDLVEAKKMKAASKFMVKHLENNRRVKLKVLRQKIRSGSNGDARENAQIRLHF